MVDVEALNRALKLRQLANKVNAWPLATLEGLVRGLSQLDLGEAEPGSEEERVRLAAARLEHHLQQVAGILPELFLDLKTLADRYQQRSGVSLPEQGRLPLGVGGIAAPEYGCGATWD